METLKRIYCKSCGAPIEKKDIDLARGFARCGYCGTVSRIDVERPTAPAAASAYPQERPEIPMPENFAVYHVGDLLQLVRRWFTPSHIFVLLIAIFWNGFNVVFGAFSLIPGVCIMLLFQLPFIAIGVFLLYWALAGFVNRTTIQVGQGWLVTKHTPLPWWGEAQIEAAQIVQCYTYEKVTYGRNGVSRSYEVHAILRDRTDKIIVKDLPNPPQALYIEQEVERYLRIKDEPIRGELPR